VCLEMDSEPVKLWRDFARLNLSASWKADVDKTVKDLSLWKSILAQWKREKRHPGIKGLLVEYERREFDRNENRERRTDVREHIEPRLSERGHSQMFTMRRSASGWKG